MKSMNNLGVPVPVKKNLVVRTLKSISREDRERALEKTEYNMFSFPADLLTIDFLSDSGTTSMTDVQWASLFHGDESYGRNKGYYVLLESIRDTFERGDKPVRAVDHILNGEYDTNTLMEEIYLKSYEGGFVNGGIPQLARPNAFIVPQGRCAEHLLFSTLAQVLREEYPNKDFYIPSNGHFDTTEANIEANGIHPVNLFSKEDIFGEFPVEKLETENPFKGNMDVSKLKNIIEAKGSDSIPLIYLTITNNTAAGQPVSMQNIEQVYRISHQHGIPLFLDACRFAENAFFIKKFENGYQNESIQEITKKMFSFADGFTISFKKDGLANMGGGLFFKDKGTFHRKYSIEEDVGTRLKEKQILTFGNDSYGGLSGRDIMSIAVGLHEVVKLPYLSARIYQVMEFARELSLNGVPVILPVGGHAIYIDMNKFFEGTDHKIEDFGGVGFTIELLRHYGIRGVELGPFAFEYDKKELEQRECILNLVRFAIPRNTYDYSHIKYSVAAITEIYKNRHLIPKVEISRGKNLRLRHFQTGLKPIYNNQ